MKHYAFPKIRQYHQVLQSLKLSYQFSGVDEKGDPIYDDTKELPIITFEGFVKLHGTNAAIVINSDGTYYCQSRENVIDQIKDNAGFAHWVAKDGYKIVPHFKSDNDGVRTIVYGEWCGGSIQGGVALSSMQKMFVIFGVKQVFTTDNSNEEVTSVWSSTSYENPDIGVFNVRRTKPYIIEVDLNQANKSIEIMNQWVDSIDKECPFAKTFDISGHGEGIVFKPIDDPSFSRAFKVKGESHSKSHVKKTITVEVVKLDSIQVAVETYCNEDRLEQGYGIVVSSPADAVPQKIANFIKWVVEDIWNEESDSLLASDISRKEITGAVSKKAATWFQNKLKSSVITYLYP